MRKLLTAAAAIAIASTVVLSGPANAAETLTAEGSSFAYGRISACAATYTTNTVTYKASSSGTGRTAFAAGTVDFAGSDAVYTKDFPTKAYQYVPVTGGPIAFAYNVSGVDGLRLTPALISGIFSGKITMWNDPAIAKINKTAKLPNKKITVAYRSNSSGTSENFTDYLVQSTKDGWKKSSTFESAAPNLPTSKITGTTSQEIATKIDATGYSIGYVDLFEVIDLDLQFASISNFYTVTTTKKVNGKTVKSTSTRTQFVAPTEAAAGLFLAAQTSTLAADGSIKIDYTKRVKNAYPASLFTYLIVPTADNTAKGAAIRDFVNYAVNTCKATKGYATFSASFKKTVTTKLINKIG